MSHNNDVMIQLSFPWGYIKGELLLKQLYYFVSINNPELFSTTFTNLLLDGFLTFLVLQEIRRVPITKSGVFADNSQTHTERLTNTLDRGIY